MIHQFSQPCLGKVIAAFGQNKEVKKPWRPVLGKGAVQTGDAAEPARAPSCSFHSLAAGIDSHKLFAARSQRLSQCPCGAAKFKSRMELGPWQARQQESTLVLLVPRPGVPRFGAVRVDGVELLLQPAGTVRAHRRELTSYVDERFKGTPKMGQHLG